MRDFLSKTADRQYILISLLGAPVLAFLLSYFTKNMSGDAYTFSENENLPAYMFMCVITALFMGLIISAEEIVRDRKILKRESFLNLSWFSYLNSKVCHDVHHLGNSDYFICLCRQSGTWYQGNDPRSTGLYFQYLLPCQSDWTEQSHRHLTRQLQFIFLSLL